MGRSIPYDQRYARKWGDYIIPIIADVFDLVNSLPYDLGVLSVIGDLFSAYGPKIWYEYSAKRRGISDERQREANRYFKAASRTTLIPYDVLEGLGPWGAVLGYALEAIPEQTWALWAADHPDSPLARLLLVYGFIKEKSKDLYKEKK